MTFFRRARLLLLAPLALVPQPARAQAPEQVVTIVQIGGGVDSSYADFLIGELHRAAKRHDLAVVIRFNSSGTVEVDPNRITHTIAESPVPVLTWVGPKGRHASGAVARMWGSGDLRLVARGTTVGPAYPEAIGGTTPKIGVGGRPPAYFGRRLTDAELVSAGIANDTAGTLFEAVRYLDGKTVNGQVVRIDQQTATIRFARPGPVVAVRHALATNPTLVYLLLLTGIGAIVFEAFQPGFGPAGYAGAVLVLLAAYGLVALPTSLAGLVVLLAGVGGMALDVRRDAIGIPTWAGAVLLAFGSWVLVHSNGPGLRPATWAIVVGVLGSLLFYGIVMTVVLRALRGQNARLGQALVGRTGEVRSVLNPQGHVLVEGALWRARAEGWDGSVPAGTRVRVTGVDEEALVLDVAPVAEE